MKVMLWGVRGSLPSPIPPERIEQRLRQVLNTFFERGHRQKTDIEHFLATLPPFTRHGFGGNTACIEVITPGQSIIIDGGSGIRRLGEKLMGGPCGAGKGEVHIFFTHFHWDHLIGLPFFIPLFVPGNKIHFHAVQPNLEKIIRQVFTKPFFPVPFEHLGSQISFHQLEPRAKARIADIELTPYELDHPDPCWGYRIVSHERIFSYCVDTEATRVSAADLGPDLSLYQGVDLMVFDGQYTLIEATEKINWGHAAAPIGLDIAIREGVKKILFVHHDPAASDEKIADAEEQTRDYFNAIMEGIKSTGKPVPKLEWGFAYEGMLLTV